MLTPQDSGVDLDQFMDEALALRSGVVLPKIDEGPVELIERLTDVRTRLDRVEELLSVLVRLRGRTRVGLKAATEVYEEKWATAVAEVNRRSKGAHDGWGSSAPRERYADADLTALAEKREQRRFERFQDKVDTAVDVVRQAHRGLESIRMDLHLILRAMNVETSLER